jgi:hypothetical protein
VTQRVERIWEGARGFTRADSQKVAGRPGPASLPAPGGPAYPAREGFL